MLDPRLDPRTRRRSASAAVAALLVALTVSAGAQDFPTHEAHIRYQGNHPDETTPDWSEDAQGITHDTDHWYLTQSFVLWRVPVGNDIASVEYGDPGVSWIHIANVPELWNDGHDHYGDLSLYTYAGTDYLLVPVQGGPDGLAIFRADDLTYIDHVPFPGGGGAG
jgi:hypothetical protein